LRITPCSIRFSIPHPLLTLARVTSPLALLLYERLLPGSALGNKLRDQSYRIQHLTVAANLVATAESEKPLVVFVDLELKNSSPFEAIRALKATAGTTHLPILAFSSPRHEKLQADAIAAGATLIASDESILAQLPTMLDQAMAVE
jgi:PleD family two-component response regulator